MHGVDEGTMPALRAALDPLAKGGDLFGTDGWMEFKGRAVLVHPHGKGKDLGLAYKLWELSEEMTGLDLSARLEGCKPAVLGPMEKGQ
jgi:hypothetical protein